MKRLLLAMFVAMSFLLLACGDGSKSDSSNDTDASSPGALMDSAPPLAAPANPAESSMETQMKAPPGADQATRKEITTGSVNITASDPIDAARKVADRVTSLDGRIDDRTEQPGTDNYTKPRATLTVRVPSDKTDQLIDDLQDFGKVTSISVSKSDVTLQYEDVDARIKALQTSVDRLRALIAGATNTADLIEAENALSNRQAELDGLTAQKRALDDQIELSTLTIEFATEDAPPPGEDPGPDNFWDGIVAGWNSLVDAIGAVVVFIGKAIPWLGFLAVVGAVIWIGWRVLGRTRRHGRQQPQPQPEPTREHVEAPAADK